MELIIASNNKGKLRELRAMLSGLSIQTMEEAGFTEEIEEPFFTFEENAHAKAAAVYRFSGKNVLSDDSGICVRALNNAPGVFSARYAGEPKDDRRNLEKLLEELKGHNDRSAFYKAVICLYWNNLPYYFEGICEGAILEEPRGEGGFGYDPVFAPTGYDQSFGELSPDIKHALSHRGKAIQQMVAFIKEHTEE